MLRLVGQCLELDRTNREKNRAGAAIAKRLASLTEREVEVMELVIAGKLNKQIADVLNISIKTVEVHRARIMDKMDVRTVAELVQAVMRVRQ
jgi:FixJ family two-component response regulator